jgi:hypothetical protein
MQSHDPHILTDGHRGVWGRINYRWEGGEKGHGVICRRLGTTFPQERRKIDGETVCLRHVNGVENAKAD